MIDKRSDRRSGVSFSNGEFMVKLRSECGFPGGERAILWFALWALRPSGRGDSFSLFMVFCFPFRLPVLKVLGQGETKDSYTEV